MKSTAPARVLILSDRVVAPAISRGATYEFEDLIGTVDTLDLRPVGAFPGRIGSHLERLVPGVFPTPEKLDRGEPYDLLFASFHTLKGVARLHPLGRILSLARRTAINIDELWCTSLLRSPGDLEILRRFDLIFSPCAGALELVRKATGRPCIYLAPSIDALRFIPGARPLRRVIDIHLMGRRHPDLHRALSAAAEKSDRFYYYDSLQSNPPMANYVEHRLRLSELIRRSRFFAVDIANSDFPEKRGDQEEFGPRFIEGAAGGAILIGRTPQSPTFEAQFWPGAVLPIGNDGAAIASALDELDAQPEKTERMRRTSVVHVLRRHDGSHRWEQILRAAGLEPLPALLTRKKRLEQLAADIEREGADA